MNPDDKAQERKRNIADAAFNPEQGLRTCKHCGATVPYQVVPNVKTGELVAGAISTWSRPGDCPVDGDRPCPFLAED